MQTRLLFNKLNTPAKIQDYLDKLPINFEKEGETYRSPSEVIKHGEAHCFEGALLALAALHQNKYRAYLLDLKTKNLKKDADHVVVLFKQGGRWGAISKTNHPVLRWRDPIYRTPEMLAYSYFHEYFMDDGAKSLISYSKPFDVFAKFGKRWVSADHDLDEIAIALDRSKHYNFYNKFQGKFLRRASSLEIRASSLTQYKNARRTKSKIRAKTGANRRKKTDT